jgi:uncharacterized repeat protein (TIGR02543 family)
MTRQELNPKKSIKQTKRNEKLIMFRKPINSVVVRRFVTAITAFALSLSGLVFSPAQANVPVDGSYSCSTGVKDGPAPSYTISGGVVSKGGSCTGAVLIPTGVTSIGEFGAAETMTSVNIPATVTSIGAYAFRYTRALTSVTIPASVQSIGTYAFGDTNKLTTVTFESGSQLKSIGESAFREAGSLTSFTVPSGVTSIGAFAFRDTGKLTTITIPASVTSIGSGALSNTRSLEFIVVDSTNLDFKVVDGVLFNEAGTTLIKYPAKKADTEYAIPAGVTNIDGAFSGASNLESVTIPSGVTSIGDYTFLQASKLTSINIPEGVTSIGEGAFAQSGLTEFVIPTTVTSIGKEAFAFVRKLTSINIPEGVTSIQDFAFYQNNSLASITFPASLTSIGREAFFSAGLTAITIPANVASIGPRAFEDTVRLTSVTFESGSKLATIGDRAFMDSKKLTAITIPASVASIGNDAFRGSLELDFVRFLGNVAPTVGTDAFTGVANSAKAIIESGAALAFPATGNPARWNGLEVVAPTKIYENVFFDSKGGSTVGTRFFSEEITAPVAPTRAGYTFAGWTATDGGETTVTFPYTPSPTSDITLYAKWTANTNAVAFNSKGGTAVANGSFTTGGNFAAPTAPTRAGYTFAGWTATDGGETTVIFPYAPSETSDITLYAKWNLITYAVTYNSKGGTAVATGSFTTGGNFAAPTAPTRAGYTFAGWTATDGGKVTVSFPYAPSATSNITLYAKWTQNPIKAAASTKPSVTGKAIATTKGTNKLTAKKGTWTGFPTPVISYQWYSCTSQVKSATSTIPKSCSKISKATKYTIAVTNTYKGKYIAVAVTGKGTGTTATTWLSKSTAKVK